MISRKQITVEQAESAMSTGEFPEGIIASARNVAVVLTQDWCPQWSAMRRWIGSMEKDGEPDGVDIDVHEFLYNTVGIFSSFMRFKEMTLGNSLIPYVRYYVDGRLVGESNYVSKKGFLGFFQTD